MFDIKDFNASITHDLLNKALKYEYIFILKWNIHGIHNSRKSLLCDGFHTCVKKQGGQFDA